MVRSDNIIEDRQPKPFLRLKKPGNPQPPVTQELQQELLLVATMCDVPDVPWDKISTGSRHCFLRRVILASKTCV